MIVYSHTVSPRVQYIVDFLSQYYSFSIKLIYDEEKYIANADAHKINYSYHRLLPNEIWIHSHVLLFESTIRPVKIECFEHHGYKAFLKTEGDTGFDLFAAIFFLLSRYEEYLPHQKDMYGRYAHQNSLAFRECFLHLPLINIWLEDFRKLLQDKFPGFQPLTANCQLLLTYDIDMAWSFRNKGLKRSVGSIVKLFFTGKWSALRDREKVIRGKQQDPFDAYDWMDDLHIKYSLEPVYFFLVAAQNGKLDKNIDIKNLLFQNLIKRIASGSKTGLHPSWASGDHPSLLPQEKSYLERIINHPVTASRQHYIRFDLPTTFRRLLALGITDDYSMGYGSINGFRASVATAYYWYDLKRNTITPLLLHPFCFMDANAYYEEKKSPQEALQELFHYHDVIRSVNGTMVMIWHNSFLGTDPAFEGWKEVYKEFISQRVK